MFFINPTVNYTHRGTLKNFFTNSSRRLSQRQNLSYLQSILNHYNASLESDLFLKNNKMKNYAFYKTLLEKFNSMNFSKNENLEKDISFVNKIYKLTQSPTEEYYELLNKDFKSFENLYNITKATLNDNKKIHFCNKVFNEILTSRKDNHAIILELLTSNNYKKYQESFQKFVPYLRLYKNDSNVVKNLDELVNSKTYDANKYKKILNIEKVFGKSNEINGTFNKEFILNNYNESSLNFIKKISDFGYFNNEMVDQNTELLLDLYNNTNSKNIKFRDKVFHHSVFSQYHKLNSTEKLQKLENMKKIFDYSEQNKDGKSFINKLMKDEIFLNVEDLIEIFENIPVKKLNTFYDNSKNIILQTNGFSKPNRIKYLKEHITEEGFETNSFRRERKIREKYGYFKKQSFISKLAQKVSNQINLIRYKLTLQMNPNTENILLKDATKTTIKQDFETKIESKTIISKVEELETKVKEPVVEENISSKSADTIEQEEIQKLKTEQKIKRAEIKEQRRKNVLEIASKNLGVKTYAKQQNDFSLYANAMRLNLLPEIFASIAETRKIDRAVGKLHSNSANKDALELYTLINGNNKKLVNYLLKKRNVYNTRMFEVKDIINIIKKAESKIQKQKQTNKDYKARDARAYYNHLHEAKIQEYGKLARVKTSK